MWGEPSDQRFTPPVSIGPTGSVSAGGGGDRKHFNSVCQWNIRVGVNAAVVCPCDVRGPWTHHRSVWLVQTRMTDADYITAFQQLLLPVAHEVTHTQTHTHTDNIILMIMIIMCVCSVSASAGSGLCWIWCCSRRSEGKNCSDLKSVTGSVSLLFLTVCVCVCAGGDVCESSVFPHPDSHVDEFGWRSARSRSRGKNTLTSCFCQILLSTRVQSQVTCILLIKIVLFFYTYIMV